MSLDFLDTTKDLLDTMLPPTRRIDEIKAKLFKGRIEKWLCSVECEDYNFEVHEGHGGLFIRAFYFEADIYTGVLEKQYTRKWLITPEATESEVAQTAFKCVLTSHEHRVREHFKYKGERVFGPHFDVNDLVTICRNGRDNAGGRK